MTALAAKESGLTKEFISNINSNENAVMKELYLSTNVIQQAVTAQDKVIKMIADAGSWRPYRPGCRLCAPGAGKCSQNLHSCAEGLPRKKGYGNVWRHYGRRT